MFRIVRFYIHYFYKDLKDILHYCLYKAIRERNINGENGIVVNVHRKDVQQERNDWARCLAASITPW